MRVSSFGWLAAALAVLVPLLLAGPAEAQKKKKAADADSSAQESGDSGGGSVDDLMEQSAKPKKAEEAEPEEAEPEEEIPEPDAWERPPVEEEKAPVKVEAPVAEPIKGDGRQIEVGLLLGYGFSMDDEFAVDPYGLGFGLRFGYEFDFKLFVGGGFEYFLGSSETLARAQGAIDMGEIEASANYMFAHLEAGYDLWFSDVIFRPSVWLGMGFATIDPDPETNSSNTISDFFFAPGASVLYVTDGFFIGGDLRFFMVTGDGTGGIVPFVNGGLRF